MATGETATHIRTTRNFNTLSLPVNFISKNNSARHGNGRAGVRRHFDLGDATLERNVHRGLCSVVVFGECDDGAVRHGIAAAIAHWIGLQLELLPRRLRAYAQPAWVAWNLLDDAFAGDPAHLRHEFAHTLLRRRIQLYPGRSVRCCHVAMLRRTGGRSEIKGNGSGLGNQVVVGIENVDRAADSVVQAYRKARW